MIREDGVPTGYHIAWVVEPRWWVRCWYRLRRRDVPKFPVYAGAFGLPSIEIDHYVEYWSVPD